MRGIDCAHSQFMKKIGFLKRKYSFFEDKKMRKMTIFASKTQIFPDSGSEKYFQGSRLRVIVSPHKITP